MRPPRAALTAAGAGSSAAVLPSRAGDEYRPHRLAGRYRQRIIESKQRAKRAAAAGIRSGGLVGEAGFEPTTSCSQSRRATGLRHSPLRTAYRTPTPFAARRFQARRSAGAHPRRRRPGSRCPPMSLHDERALHLRVHRAPVRVHARRERERHDFRLLGVQPDIDALPLHVKVVVHDIFVVDDDPHGVA